MSFNIFINYHAALTFLTALIVDSQRVKDLTFVVKNIEAIQKLYTHIIFLWKKQHLFRSYIQNNLILSKNKFIFKYMVHAQAFGNYFVGHCIDVNVASGSSTHN